MSGEKINGLEAIADAFDVFLIDQFGVLLNGAEQAYPGAIDALNRLSSMGKQILLLSNSGKRSAPNNDRLVAAGFARESFNRVLSSGEVAFHYLQSQINNGINEGAKVFVITRDDNGLSLDGLPLTQTNKPEDADLVLLISSQSNNVTLLDYQDMLQDPVKRGVVCLCTNPDMIMLTVDGKTFSTGKIAQLYQQMGGTVDLIGKPYPLIYQTAYQVLNQPDASRVICIGDSPLHDIKGGLEAGYTTALVRTGIHADMDDADLVRSCRKLQALPDYILPGFAFST